MEQPISVPQGYGEDKDDGEEVAWVELLVGEPDETADGVEVAPNVDEVAVGVELAAVFLEDLQVPKPVWQPLPQWSFDEPQ